MSNPNPNTKSQATATVIINGEQRQLPLDEKCNLTKEAKEIITQHHMSNITVTDVTEGCTTPSQKAKQNWDLARKLVFEGVEKRKKLRMNMRELVKKVSNDNVQNNELVDELTKEVNKEEQRKHKQIYENTMELLKRDEMQIQESLPVKEQIKQPPEFSSILYFMGNQPQPQQQKPNSKGGFFKGKGKNTCAKKSRRKSREKKKKKKKTHKYKQSRYKQCGGNRNGVKLIHGVFELETIDLMKEGYLYELISNNQNVYNYFIKCNKDLKQTLESRKLSLQTKVGYTVECPYDTTVSYILNTLDTNFDEFMRTGNVEDTTTKGKIKIKREDISIVTNVINAINNILTYEGNNYQALRLTKKGEKDVNMGISKMKPTKEPLVTKKTKKIKKIKKSEMAIKTMDNQGHIIIQHANELEIVLKKTADLINQVNTLLKPNMEELFNDISKFDGQAYVFGNIFNKEFVEKIGKELTNLFEKAHKVITETQQTIGNQANKTVSVAKDMSKRVSELYSKYVEGVVNKITQKIQTQGDNVIEQAKNIVEAADKFAKSTIDASTAIRGKVTNISEKVTDTFNHGLDLLNNISMPKVHIPEVHMSDFSPVLKLFESIGSGIGGIVNGIGSGIGGIVKGIGSGIGEIVHCIGDLEALFEMIKGCGYLITFIGIVLCGLFTGGGCWAALLLAYLGVEGTDAAIKAVIAGGSKTKRIKYRRKKRTSKKLT
jgi:hypothetical protein